MKLRTLLKLSIVSSIFVLSALTAQISFAYTVDAPPPGFVIQTVATGFNQPTDMAFAPDGGVFVAEKYGTVRHITNGVIDSNAVITLPKVNFRGDRGLLSIALDPAFPSKRYLYLLYTYENDIQIRMHRRLHSSCVLRSM